MTTIAYRKGIILSANDNGTYSVEDNDLNETIFADLAAATRWWQFLISQE